MCVCVYVWTLCVLCMCVCASQGTLLSYGGRRCNSSISCALMASTVQGGGVSAQGVEFVYKGARVQADTEEHQKPWGQLFQLAGIH